jgi:outer membrane protein
MLTPMRRIPTIALALSALLIAGSALAQIPPPQTTPPPAGQAAKPPAATPTPTATPRPVEPFPAGAMVAFVDLQHVVANSKLGKAGHDQMTALNDKLGASLATKNKEIQTLQDKIKTQQNLVNDATIQSMARDLDKATREAQFMQQDSQVQINQLNEQLLTNFQEKVLPIVEDLRKEKGLWIIFALGDNSNIAAAHAGLDLSQEIIKRLDTKYPK